MSYKKKKLKKNILGRLKHRIKSKVLFNFKKIISSLKNKQIKKEVTMQQRQTTNVMQMLRKKSKNTRSNNLRINEWVDEYIDRCVLNGKPVEILTQYCLSKDLETRYKIQGNKFIPLPAEIDMFSRDIPRIIEMFKNNNISVNWYITFNNSFLDRGRISEELVSLYSGMIENLSLNSEVLFFNWERDILGKRPEPNEEVLIKFKELIPQKAFDLDIENLLRRVQQQPNFAKTKEEIYKEAVFKIACEVEEGKFIFDDQGYFKGGDVLITPLEFPERLIFFETFAPGFQKRIVPILKLYPWRIDADSIKYES